MKTWLRLRLACSLLLGVCAGWFASTLPPAPLATVALPIRASVDADSDWHLHGLSSDGRYLLIEQRQHLAANFPKLSCQVWDRQGTMQEPTIISNPPPETYGSMLLSADESRLVIAYNGRVEVYDLESRRKTSAFRMEGQHFFRASDGRIYYISQRRARASAVHDLIPGN